MIDVRRLDRAEAIAQGDRFRAIFRDAVLAAGPRHYTPAQVQAWAATADDLDRWASWLAEGTTWIAVLDEEPSRPIGLLMLWPADYVHLLYIDPAHHRKGIATMLPKTLDRSAARLGVKALSADASLISHPVFASCGFEVLAWENVDRRGEVFRRARMQKAFG